MTVAELAALPLPERWVISRCHQLDRLRHRAARRVRLWPTAALERPSTSSSGTSTRLVPPDRLDGGASRARRRPRRRRRRSRRARRSCTPSTRACGCCRLHAVRDGGDLAEAAARGCERRSWSRGPQRDDEALPVDEDAIAQFDSFQSLVRSIRNARASTASSPPRRSARTSLVNGDLGWAALQAEADALAFARARRPRQPVASRGGRRGAAAAGRWTTTTPRCASSWARSSRRACCALSEMAAPTRSGSASASRRPTSRRRSRSPRGVLATVDRPTRRRPRRRRPDGSSPSRLEKLAAAPSADELRAA